MFNTRFDSLLKKEQDSLFLRSSEFITLYLKSVSREDLFDLVSKKDSSLSCVDVKLQVLTARNDSGVCVEVFRYAMNICLGLKTELGYFAWKAVADVCVDLMKDHIKVDCSYTIEDRQALLQYCVHMLVRLRNIAKEDGLYDSGVNCV